MTLSSGELDKRISIERATVTTDGYGGEDKVWTEFCPAWAKVINGRGDERRSAAQENASLAATFRVRANSKTRDVATTDRIVFDGAAWDISSNVAFGTDGRDITAIRPA